MCGRDISLLTGFCYKSVQAKVTCGREISLLTGFFTSLLFQAEVMCGREISLLTGFCYKSALSG
jgi:flagellar biosynthesis protein FliR